MSGKMASLEAKFNAISAREQKLLFYVLPLAICFIFVLGFIEPTFVKSMEIRNQIQNLKVQQLSTTVSLQAIQAELSVEPDIDTKKQIAAIESKLNALKKKFADELELLVPPTAMPLMLEQLFAQATKLRLMQMRSLAPRNIFANVAENESKQSPNVQEVPAPSLSPKLYQHGLKITFEGSFFDTRDFLLSAEQMGWKLHWQEILYDVHEYPKAKVDIELFTLSMSEVYINVN